MTLFHTTCRHTYVWGGAGLPVNRNSLPPHAGTVGDFGEKMHMNINFKQRLIVYPVELILDMKGNCDIISNAATVFWGVPFAHLLTLIVFWIPVSQSYSVSKQKKERRKACKEGLLSVPLCGWTSNSSQQLKPLSEAVILQLVEKKRSGVQDFSVQALEVVISRTWPSHMDNTSANQRRIPILSLSFK